VGKEVIVGSKSGYDQARVRDILSPGEAGQQERETEGVKEVKKTVVVILVAAMLFATALVYSAGQKDRQPAGVTLNYMWWTPMYEPYISAAIRTFEGANPGVRVSYTTLAWDEYWQKVQTLMASGAPPDIMDMDVSRTWDFSHMDALYAIDDFIRKDMDKFYKNAIDMERYPDQKGKLYVKPYQWVCSILFYNRDLFDAAGVAYPDREWDYEKMIAVSRKLSADTNADGKTDRYGFFANYSHTFLDNMIKAYGAYVIKPDFHCGLTDPNAVKVIQKVADMMLVDKSAPVAASYDAMLVSGGEVFRSGTVGMTIDGSYMIDSFRSESFRWDATMVPKGPAKRSIYGGPDGICMLKTTKYPKQSWAFIEFMTGPDRPRETWLPGGVPIIKELSRSSSWREMHAKWLSDPSIILDSGQYMEGADFQTPSWDEWRYDAMNSELAYAAIGQKPVKDAAQAACERIDKVLERTIKR
jgi:multiple sugar transport system substrate-binding protein